MHKRRIKKTYQRTVNKKVTEIVAWYNIIECIFYYLLLINYLDFK